MKKSITILSGVCLLAIGGIFGWVLRERKGFAAARSLSAAPAVAGFGETSEAKSGASTSILGAANFRNSENALRVSSYKQRLEAIISGDKAFDSSSSDYWKLTREILAMEHPEALELIDWLVGKSNEKLPEGSADNLSVLEDFMMPTLFAQSLSGDPWIVEQRMKELFKDSDKSFSSHLDIQLLFDRKAQADLPRLVREIHEMHQKQDSDFDFKIALNAVITEMARTDPAAALDFTLKKSTELQMECDVRPFSKDLMRVNPEGTIQKVMDSNRQNHPMVATLISEWTGLDPDAVKIWQKGQSDALRSLSLLALLRAGNLDAGGLLNEITGWNPGPWGHDFTPIDPFEQPKPYDAIGSRLGECLAGDYPDEVGMGKLQQLPIAFRESAEKAFLKKSLEWDLLEASEVLKALPAGRSKNFGIEALVSVYALAKEDPASALQWALHHSDEAKRASLVKEVVREWRSNDPEASMKAEAALPEEIRSTLNQRE